MWINFTFHHMTDVEKSEISFIMCTIYGILLHFTLFCCKKFCFFAIYAVFRKIGLLQFTRYCVEKILAKNSDRGEKMTNMRYGADLFRYNFFLKAQFLTLGFCRWFSILICKGLCFLFISRCCSQFGILINVFISLIWKFCVVFVWVLILRICWFLFAWGF